MLPENHNPRYFQELLFQDNFLFPYIKPYKRLIYQLFIGLIVGITISGAKTIEEIAA